MQQLGWVDMTRIVSSAPGQRKKVDMKTNRTGEKLSLSKGGARGRKTS
jgi:hypothetical protein